MAAVPAQPAVELPSPQKPTPPPPPPPPPPSPPGKSKYIKLLLEDGHEMILSTRFCRQSPVLMSMASPPIHGNLEEDDDNDEPRKVKCRALSHEMMVISRYLMFKTWCMETGVVRDFDVSPQDAIAAFFLATFFQI